MHLSKGLNSESIISVATRVVGMGCAFIQVRYAIQGVGVTAFGAWVAMYSWASLMVFLDVGVGYAMQNAASRLSAQHRKCTSLWFETAFVFSASAACLAMLVLVCAAKFALSRVYLHKLGGLMTNEEWLFDCAVIAIVAGVLIVPSSIVMKYACAIKRVSLTNWATMVVNVALSSAIVWAAATKVVSVKLYAALLGSQQVLPGVVVAVVLACSGEIRWIPRSFSRRRLRALVPQGLAFVPAATAAMPMVNVPQILAAYIGGASGAALWNTAFRLSNAVLGVQQGFLQPLWPAFTRARALGEVEWVRAAYARAVRWSIVAFGLPLLLLPLWGPFVLKMWVGDAVEPTNAFMVVFGLYAMFQAFIQPAAVLLNSAGRPLRQGIVGTVCIVLITMTVAVLAGFGSVNVVAIACMCWFGLLTVPVVWFEARSIIAE